MHFRSRSFERKDRAACLFCGLFLIEDVQNDGEVQGLLLLFKWQRCVTLKLIRILWT
ncbi:Uncharacterized protein BM_BM13082 [Brugia malayi]|uniref:Bm13082 n=1 Tax=Brugia malayi TaxID=6279 RepID=A0A0J9XSW1_BRUMA|nr:Uncharacterized protein BM_BM13082 [Brugia malayi]CDP95046.1 Bm13082 [Brugia malayi]VIO87160.1 Uncharacterized protein BM_BM13082 [Brugia malayi]